jgi:hypothetical protein
MTKDQAKNLKVGDDVWYYHHIFSLGVNKVKIHNLMPYDYLPVLMIIEYHDDCRDEANISELFLTELEALLAECEYFKSRIGELQEETQDFQDKLEGDQQRITDILLSEGKSGAEVVHILVETI